MYTPNGKGSYTAEGYSKHSLIDKEQKAVCEFRYPIEIKENGDIVLFLIYQGMSDKISRKIVKSTSITY